MIRTFVAIALADAPRQALGRLIERLRPELPGARWVEPANLHLTLAFLGDVAEERLARVLAAVGEAVRAPLPFALELSGLGAFPDARRPRVVWAGIAGDALPRLLELQRAVAAACAASGYPADPKFHPHVTLARFRPGRVPDLRAMLEREVGWSGGEVGVRDVVVYASELGPRGVVYRVLVRCPLGTG